MTLAQDIHEARQAVGLADETDFQAWLFEEALPEPQTPAQERVLLGRLQDRLFADPTPEPDFPLSLANLTRSDLREIVQGFPLRDRFNALAQKLGLLPSAAVSQYGLTSSDDYPRVIAAMEADVEASR